MVVHKTQPPRSDCHLLSPRSMAWKQLCGQKWRRLVEFRVSQLHQWWWNIALISIFILGQAHIPSSITSLYQCTSIQLLGQDITLTRRIEILHSSLWAPSQTNLRMRWSLGLIVKGQTAYSTTGPGVRGPEVPYQSAAPCISTRDLRQAERHKLPRSPCLEEHLWISAEDKHRISTSFSGPHRTL